jgi:hypothetical protein
LPRGIPEAEKALGPVRFAQRPILRRPAPKAVVAATPRSILSDASMVAPSLNAGSAARRPIVRAAASACVRIAERKPFASIREDGLLDGDQCACVDQHPIDTLGASVSTSIGDLYRIAELEEAEFENGAQATLLTTSRSVLSDVSTAASLNADFAGASCVGLSVGESAHAQKRPDFCKSKLEQSL